MEEEEAGPLPRLRQRGLPRGGGRGRRRGGVRPPPPRRAALQAAAEDEVRQARLGGRAEQGTGQTVFFICLIGTYGIASGVAILFCRYGPAVFPGAEGY